MCYTTCLCIIVVAATMFSCGSTHKKATQKSNVDSANQSNTGKDTIPVPPIPAPHHAPNTTLAKGKIISVHSSKTDSSGVIKFQVLKFLGMGSGAAAVSPGDTLTVKVLAMSKVFKEGKILKAALKYQQVLAKYKKTAPRWLLVGVEKQKNKQNK